MSNPEELQEFSLDDIMNEFHQEPAAQDLPEPPQTQETQSAQEEAPVQEEQPTREEVPVQEEQPAQEEQPVQEEASVQEEQPAQENAPAEKLPGEPADSAEGLEGDTIVSDEELSLLLRSIDEDIELTEEELQKPTLRLEKLSDVEKAQAEEKATPKPVEVKPQPVVIELDPKARLRELKRKLIAGPEKRYYELEELGLGRLQTSVFLNFIIVLLCAGVTALFTMEMVPDNRLRLVIFSQVLAMLVSAWLGCHQLMDGLADLLKFRFTADTLLALTFISCCVDAVFCLQELRVPCCAAFSLEMMLAQLSRRQRRSTYMAQMDTLRKAVRLHSLVKTPDYFEGMPGILRGYGDVDHFMNNYEKTTGPEKFRNVYCFVSLLLSCGIAVFAGLRSGVSMAIQVFSTSLLVAVPASYFIALSRPLAILQKRLHMVGAVLCGWQGVKALKGKNTFAVKDEDLFPAGAAKLNGVKFYGDRKSDEVITCAASVICAAGGGLVHSFRQLLTSRGGRELPVKNLRSYSGGLGGEVAGESVLLGSSAFLQAMGVDIPDGAMVNQAVYVSLDGELCAVVAISYGKMRSSAGGIVSLSGSRKLKPVMVGSDFMVTESLVRSKFGVNTRRIAFPDQETRIKLRERQPDPEAVAMALTTREDLISFAYAISGARALRTSCVLGTVLHVFGGVLGMLIMLVLAYLGNTELLAPTNILLYQLVWLLPGLLITEWTRTV